MSQSKLSFMIVSCSGEDLEHKASELNEKSTSSKGYMTPPNCEYPQEIVLKLSDERCRVNQVQILSHQTHIATKIELYSSASEAPLPDLHYERLGFFTLKPNTESSYMARELKTVHIDQELIYLKFVLHACYINERNMYSQVGIMAIHLHGHVMSRSPTQDQELPGNEYFLRASATPSTYDKAIPSKVDSNLLAFDNKTAERIREIQIAKEAAVANEDYDQAKRLKQIEEQLKGIGIQLSRLEIQKREAVANEDYDLAKRIKNEITCLEASVGSNESVPIVRSSNEEAGLVRARSNKNVRPKEESLSVENSHEEAVTRGRIREDSASQRPISARSEAADEDASRSEGTMNPHFAGISDAEKLPDPDELPAALAGESEDLMDIFGEYMIRCFYSNLWNHRDAVIRKVCMEFPVYMDQNRDTNRFFQACCTLLQNGIGDRVGQVCVSCFRLLEKLIEQFCCTRVKDLTRMIDNTVAQLVYKLGVAQTKLRDEATQCLVQLAELETVGVAFIMSHLLKRSRKVIGLKLLQGRCQVVKILLKKEMWDLEPDSAYSLEEITAFLQDTSGFTHQSKEIRELAKEIMVALYLIVGQEVEKCLTSLRPKQLEEYRTAFEIADAQGHTTNNKSRQDKREQAQPPTRAPKAPKRETHSREQAQPEITEYEDPDSGCPFCGFIDEDLDDEQMDHHYWADCLMLTPCKLCGQIIEISALNDHLLNECEWKDNHCECPRCGEAIHGKFYDKHVSLQDCLPRPPIKRASRCPLCHEDITPAGKKGWEKHLLDESCPRNPRQVELPHCQGYFMNNRIRRQSATS